MASETTTSEDAAHRMLDRLDAAETVSAFYNALQNFHCNATGFDAFEALIADEMVYLSPSFRDTTPVRRAPFLEWFLGIQSVHARPGRGSFYAVVSTVTRVDGDRAHLDGQLIAAHWLGPANDHATWFYGPLEVDLVRAGSRWQIALISTTAVRQEGRVPPVNYLHPDLESEA